MKTQNQDEMNGTAKKFYMPGPIQLHTVDLILFPRFSKLYMDNKPFGDQEMGITFPRSQFYAGKGSLTLLQIPQWTVSMQR